MVYVDASNKVVHEGLTSRVELQVFLSEGEAHRRDVYEPRAPLSLHEMPYKVLRDDRRCKDIVGEELSEVRVRHFEEESWSLDLAGIHEEAYVFLDGLQLLLELL
eukprot:CAMPEP_0170548466 /NCGR_PEP_ID=MMETSP0211-20121228/6793_1 /TAXON_ID=311385 /ORGANISM="Pseudokeronopsis sp., Strain OXSARD2" /LENGTH=104 /DNA_ID=CAMNT_0010854047 /DNA_START=205 /DNA_END=519 /DNA_ORIENTATION=-